MGETERDELKASSRLAKLQKRIQQATKLIGELRESNYSLGGEVAELKRQVESLSTGEAPPPEAATEDASELQAELEALRKERKKIRSKVKQLLDRIEKLES